MALPLALLVRRAGFPSHILPTPSCAFGLHGVMQIVSLRETVAKHPHLSTDIPCPVQAQCIAPLTNPPHRRCTQRPYIIVRADLKSAPTS
ncbi:MAG: hypothetical protein LBT61_03355 [Prevotellaceae bacterium]|nr:hypothetical protein [Prevotellaceae bacterium]